MWEYWERRAVPAKQENQNTKIHKRNNQNLDKQTQPSCVNNEGMYNRVKSTE